MNRAEQLFDQLLDQLINDLETAISKPQTNPFSQYFNSLAEPVILMQKLIKNHDALIGRAIDRHLSSKV
ncbi:hypothetical protein Syn7502_02711 [Synechococcus sp. PCC 7502]|uniref:hypothetical protein n=1 Tax=Synechococcus sp. PCC 7502 TaxID=1173263 RepID=UPI00029FC3B5|nr:hypothetical protein [Synechococcus sp. PCC 7502]AFY74662.1 hypothetical protein Syn7502_02711 [Synechococcus sp. PCC 7502]